jgi:hypothetical protein
MVEKIKFENTTENVLQICIEPVLEYIDLDKGKVLEIELKLTTAKYKDEFNFILAPNALIIYECRQYEMKIFIDKELKYATPQNLYL